MGQSAYLPASSRVTSWRPRGNGIGSSNRRFQPRSATSAPVRRHPLAPIEPTIFLCGLSLLNAPLLKTGLGPLRQEHCPSLFEIGARQVEGLRGAVGAFPPVATGIEAASPGPRIFAGRHAGPDCDRADPHVTKKDMPAFVGRFQIAAAGEGGHALLKRESLPSASPQDSFSDTPRKRW